MDILQRLHLRALSDDERAQRTSLKELRKRDREERRLRVKQLWLDTFYELLPAIRNLFAVAVFAGGWIYAISEWGWFLGLGLGWLPAFFIAVIAWFLFYIVVVVAVVILLVVMGGYV